jgi:hypothetical protein
MTFWELENIILGRAVEMLKKLVEINDNYNFH